MNREEFWQIVDGARSSAASEDNFIARLENALNQLPLKEVVEFERHLYTAHTESYSNELWGAAYLAMGGCSDDAFDYFRAWLIAQGRQSYETVTRTPDAIVELSRLPGELEDLLSLAREVYEERSGEELPDEAYEGVIRPELSGGWNFDDEAEMKRRYPRSFERFARG